MGKKFDIKTFDFSKEEISEDKVNDLNIGDMKKAFKYFPKLKLVDENLTATSQLEFMQLVIWANFKDIGMTLADTENIKFSDINMSNEE